MHNESEYMHCIQYANTISVSVQLCTVPQVNDDVVVLDVSQASAISLPATALDSDDETQETELDSDADD